MIPVTIGSLHDNIVGFLCVNRILNQRLVFVSDITGKYDFSGHTALGQPHLNAGRAKQMSHIGKSNPDAVANLDILIVRTWNKVSDNSVRILHRVRRLNRFKP